MSGYRPFTKGGRGGYRRALLAKLHIARKELGMDEGDYRALLQRVAGVSSAKTLGISPLEDVLKEMQRLGFKPTKAVRKSANPQSRKSGRSGWPSMMPSA